MYHVFLVWFRSDGCTSACFLVSEESRFAMYERRLPKFTNIAGCLHLRAREVSGQGDPYKLKYVGEHQRSSAACRASYLIRKLLHRSSDT